MFQPYVQPSFKLDGQGKGVSHICAAIVIGKVKERVILDEFQMVR